MIFFSNNHLYPFSWEYVINAFWNKYPNDIQSHVRRVDIINFSFDETSKTLYTKRLFSLSYNSPKLLERLIGSNLSGYAIEESVCDFNNKSLITRGVNYSFNNIFSIQETCSFSSRSENLESTQYKQDIKFILLRKINRFNRINKLFESTIIKSFNEKSLSGIKAMYDKIDQTKSIINYKYEVEKGISESNSNILNKGLLKDTKETLRFYEKINQLFFARFSK